ncbi:hypothetical protein [Rhodothalassium salexigens]|uniref:hypothetical protein n=1 Tax=Rhodothalassium salexigens TaxID=1086 RepID=UPI0019144F2D|nr:hypothetical protein [Rhodothalassium salexigens]
MPALLRGFPFESRASAEVAAMQPWTNKPGANAQPADSFDFQRLSIDEGRRHPAFALIGESYDIWRTLATAAGVPLRSAARPTVFARLLPFTAWMTVIDDGADFEWVSLGDLQVNQFGRDIAGLRMSEFVEVPMDSSRLVAVHRAAVLERDAVFLLARLDDHGTLYEWAGVLLPLADAAGRVTDLLGVSKSLNRLERPRHALD